MTTAHRPTWKAAIGGSEQGGNKSYVPSRAYSAKDLPGQLHLKRRREGQGTQDEYTDRDFGQELLDRESDHFSSTKTIKSQLDKEEMYEKEERVIKSGDGIYDPGARKSRKVEIADIDENNPFPQDRDDDLSSQSEDENSSESSSDSDGDSDEDAELWKEYEKLKKEKEEEKKKEEEEAQEAAQEEAILTSNPLLNGYSLKKRWDEECVFKNQTKTEPKKKPSFINDFVRSDFHRKFMSKYVK
mmetsp:Transcript_19519/g.22173  ORF Transcript_19519/g.22173 Transcript_19519/m.22173 type:complete len:243 (-) Transcript_19519:1541-2269(-)